MSGQPQNRLAQTRVRLGPVQQDQRIFQARRRFVEVLFKRDELLA